ncbi:hypothetical protein ACTJKU_41650, partial [Citrobacter freundii]
MPLLTFSCYYSLLIVNLAINFVMQAEYLHKKVPYGLRGNTNNTPKNTNEGNNEVARHNSFLDFQSKPDSDNYSRLS